MLDEHPKESTTSHATNPEPSTSHVVLSLHAKGVWSYHWKLQHTPPVPDALKSKSKVDPPHAAT